MPFSSSLRSIGSGIPDSSASSACHFAIVVERRVAVGLEGPQLLALAIRLQDGELRLRRAQRDLLALPGDAGGQDAILELVVLFCELRRREARLARLAEPVEALALVSVDLVLAVTQQLQLLAREEILVAGDDCGLLGRFLLPDPYCPTFLRPLEEVTLEALLELGRAADGCDAHGCGSLLTARRSANGQTAHGRGEVVERKGLLDQLVGTRPLDGGQRDASGQERDCNPSSLRAQLADELASVVLSEVDIDQQYIDVFLLECAPGLVERARLEHPVTLELEVDAAEEPNRRLVVRDENDRRLGRHDWTTISARSASAGYDRQVR
jgi:hypothetical protein